MHPRHAVVLLLLCLAVGEAQAQFAMSAGIEYFSWTEDTQPISVKERGPLLTFGLSYTQLKERGFLFAYQGKFYTGNVDYNGAYLYAPNVPVSGTSTYTGTWQEGQLRYRLRGGLDLLGALGVDVWERQLSTTQKEDYQVAYLRLGVESSPSVRKGWLFGAGVKYPVYTRENAYFTDFGYDNNPTLSPGKELSGFANVGYRFGKNWALIGYLDSFRFSKSNEVTLTVGGTPQATAYQPASDMYVVGVKVEYQF